MAGKYTFQQKEKLKSRKQIDHVFKHAASFASGPLKVLYVPFFFQDGTVLKAGFAVGSRNFPKAVPRNRMKRLMREAYRVEKLKLNTVLVKNRQQLAVFFIYTGKIVPEFAFIQMAMQNAIEMLIIKSNDNALC